MQRGILLLLYGSRLSFWSTFSERMIEVLCAGQVYTESVTLACLQHAAGVKI